MKNKKSRRVWQVSTARGGRRDLQNLLQQIEDNGGFIADTHPWTDEQRTVVPDSGGTMVNVQRVQCWDVIFWVWEKTQPAKGRG